MQWAVQGELDGIFQEHGWVNENKECRTDMFSELPVDAWFHVMVSSSIVDGAAEEVLYCNRVISMVPLCLTLTSINYVVRVSFAHKAM